jgi:hypothetical protein
MLHLLYDSCFPHLLALLFVLMNEAFYEDVLVANAPTLVYNDTYEREHHHNEGGGCRYGKD